MKFDINGISTPIGGISWNTSRSKKEVFAYLFLYLESKRILVNPIEMEFKDSCITSVLEIREQLVSVTRDVSFGKEDIQIIRELIDACNGYLDAVSPLKLDGIIYKNGDKWEDLNFDSAMKKFRAAFNKGIKMIEKKYRLVFNKKIPEEF